MTMTYYIAPGFLDKLSVHITKNFLDLPGVRVPLILGIHGKKGEGKSFQCQLVYEKMGIEAIHISAGELESPDAGDPARLIRLRYREAAELIKVRGQMVVLMINDLDAGAGRFDQGTQYTVNTQLVNATLMNIADNPTNVQLPGSYDATPLHRVPIIVTGNDFSTLYAPLIRDGRMEKFYWDPTREDKIGIVGGIFAEDGLTSSEIMEFVDTFVHQSVDFFSAVRSRIYDEQVKQFIYDTGFDKVGFRLLKSIDGKPVFPKPDFNLSLLIEFGNLLVREQNRISELSLVKQYNQAINVENKTAIAENQIIPSQTPILTNQNDFQIKPEIIQDLQNLINNGHNIGIEYVDQRRFKTNSWMSCAGLQTNNLSEITSALANCLAEHQRDFVRIIGIDTKAKKRILEKIIHRPQ
jgi:ribulose bisphosphate carboxylase small subunit